MSDDEHAESRSALDSVPNGLVVLLTVALLLQGPVGAFEALRDYTLNLLTALFGGEDLFREVLCQTAPLALAVAAIAFSVRCGWFSLNSTSLIGASLLLLAGTWLGGELRSLFAKNRTALSSQITVTPAAASGETPAMLSQYQIRPLAENQTSLASRRAVTADEVKISVAQAVEVLFDVRSAATSSDHYRWGERVPRVDLLPEPKTFIGIVAWAINQLLGYFVIYRPRLFLAAVLVGCYIGWSLQPWFETLRSRVGGKQLLTPA